MSSDAMYSAVFLVTPPIYFSTFCLLFISYSEHSPQSKFRAGTFFTLRYFSSFFNFNLRLKNVQINFSIHVAFVVVTHTRDCVTLTWASYSSFRSMHLKFWWKTKLHRRSAAVYIAILVHVLHASALGWGGKMLRSEKNVLQLRRRRGGNGLFTFFLLSSNGIFQKQQKPKPNTRERFSYQLRRWDKKNVRLSRQTFINRVRMCFGPLLRFYYERANEFLLEWKTLNGSRRVCFLCLAKRIKKKQSWELRIAIIHSFIHSRWKKKRHRFRCCKLMMHSRATMSRSLQP